RLFCPRNKKSVAARLLILLRTMMRFAIEPAIFIVDFAAQSLSLPEVAMSTHVLFRAIAVSLISLIGITSVSLAAPPAWKTIKPELGGFSFQMPIVPKAVDRASIGDKSQAGSISYGMEIAGGGIFVLSKPAPSKGGDKTLSQHLDASRD